MTIHVSHTPLSDGNLAIVIGLMAAVAGGAAFAMGRDAVKTGRPRSAVMGGVLGLMWGPAALPYAGAYVEAALVALVALFVSPMWLVVIWPLCPLYVAGAVALKDRRPAEVDGGPMAALAAMEAHEPDRPWLERGAVLELDYRFAGGGLPRWMWLVVGGIGAWVEFSIWLASMTPRHGQAPGGWPVFLLMNAFVVLIGLFFWAAVSQLGLRGFRARFDRANGTWALEHVQRMAGHTASGELSEIRDVRAEDVPVRAGRSEVERPGLVLHLHDGRAVPLAFFTAYPTPDATEDETRAALARDAERLRAFLAEGPAEPRPRRKTAALQKPAEPLLQRLQRQIGVRQAVLGVGLVLAGLAYAANPRGLNLFPGLVTLVKAPFLSPLDRILEAHRDGLRNIPGIKAAVYDYQYDLILGQTAGLLTSGVQRLDDRDCAAFIAANDDVTWGAAERFLVAGKAGRPVLENAEFGPELARVGPEVLRRYFKVQEDAVAATVRKEPARWEPDGDVKRAWESFYAGLPEAEVARYRKIPQDGVDTSDADLAWGTRTYWHRLRRMNHRTAASILRSDYHQRER